MSDPLSLQWERTRPIGVAGVSRQQSRRKDISHEVHRNLWVSTTVITIPILFKAGTLLRKTPISSTVRPKVGETVVGPTAKGMWQHVCSRQYVEGNVFELWYATITAMSAVSQSIAASRLDPHAEFGPFNI